MERSGQGAELRASRVDAGDLRKAEAGRDEPVEAPVAPVRNEPHAPPPSRDRRRRTVSLSMLLSLLTLAAMTPLLLLAGYFVHATVEEQRRAEIARLSELAADLASAVDRELRGQTETALVLAGSRYLRQADFLAFWEHAEDAASRADGHFVVIDENAQQHVNTRRPLGSPLPLTNDPRGALDTLRADAIQVGNLAVGAVAQQHLFAVRIPVEAEDGRRFVLAHVPRADAILDVVRQAYRPDGWFAAVVDGNGRVLARSHRHEDFFGRTITPELLDELGRGARLLESVDLEGRQSLTAMHPSSRSDWTTFVWAPRVLLEEPARQAQMMLAMLLALALAASVAAAYLAGRLIREPHRRLFQAARDLGQGKPVRFEPGLMREANVVGEALISAERTISAREGALRDADAQIRIVLQELSHRSKNLLAVVQAMVSQSARYSPDFEHFQTRFRERLSGLARSQDLLVQMDWKSIPMEELILAQLAPFSERGDDRILLDGPPLLLKPQAAQSLGLALHELATNAMKHGSLSVPAGRVRVAWELERDGEGREMVRLRWSESGGPPVGVPERTGFGSVVIGRIAPASLSGTARIDWRREGLVWEVEAPASSVV